MKFAVFVAVSFALSSAALPRMRRGNSFDLQNGQDAIAQNNKFASLTANSSCTEGEDACVDSGFAQCVNGQFVVQPCGAGTICAALPLVNSPGTSIACTTQADLDARLAATGATSGSSSAGVSSAATTSVAATKAAAATSTAPSVVSSTIVSSAAAAASSAASSGNNAAGGSAAAGGNSTDEQSSLTLDPAVVATGFENDGQDVPAAGQVASLTSSDNFINFCLTVPDLPLTNGTQIKTGSCNPAPMGVIAANTSMPSSKFSNPKNFDTIPANQTFNIVMNIKNLDAGFFVNADENYFAAPQTTNAQGLIQGHSHVVIEAITSLTQTTPTDPTTFQFFKGLNDPAVNGQLNVTVTGGVPAGVYRLASINTAANHQPVLVSVAQHGSLDDMIYFTAE